MDGIIIIFFVENFNNECEGGKVVACGFFPVDSKKTKNNRKYEMCKHAPTHAHTHANTHTMLLYFVLG